jgi:hypothetical protein
VRGYRSNFSNMAGWSPGVLMRQGYQDLPETSSQSGVRFFN